MCSLYNNKMIVVAVCIYFVLFFNAPVIRAQNQSTWVLFTPALISSNYDAQLQRMVAERWGTYIKKIKHPEPEKGGVALYISSPMGNFFASTNMTDASPKIHFRAASITKTFTAAAIMLLYQRGELNIDDPVTAHAPLKSIPYLPDSKNYNIPNKNSITIRSLLNHSAGVFDLENETIPDDADCPFAGQDYVEDLSSQSPNHQFTFDELAGIVAACKIKESDPWQDEFNYSDTGYSLLGKIIERVSGMSYSDFIINNLIKPNGLNNTFSPHNAYDTAMPEPSTVSYNLFEGQLTEFSERNMSAGIANGNIISTPADLIRWLGNLLTRRAGIQKKYIDMMMDCTIPEGEGSCYGFGMFTWEGLGYGHTGGTNGYLSIVTYDPISDVSVASFFSLYNVNSLDALGEEGKLLAEMVAEAKTILGY